MDIDKAIITLLAMARGYGLGLFLVSFLPKLKEDEKHSMLLRGILLVLVVISFQLVMYMAEKS